MTDSLNEHPEVPVSHLDAAVVQLEQDVIFGWTPKKIKLDVPDDAVED